MASPRSELAQDLQRAYDKALQLGYTAEDLIELLQQLAEQQAAKKAEEAEAQVAAVGEQRTQVLKPWQREPMPTSPEELAGLSVTRVRHIARQLKLRNYLTRPVDELREEIRKRLFPEPIAETVNDASVQADQRIEDDGEAPTGLDDTWLVEQKKAYDAAAADPLKG